jgi:hypothetical protein
MASKGSSDKFANYAIVYAEEPSANHLTFKKLETGISLNEKVAWVINRIEYFVGGLNEAIFNTDTDALNYGLSVSNSFSTASHREDTIIDFNIVQRLDYGTPANSNLFVRPQVKDLASMPGGGIIVPPVPLYLFIQGSGLAYADSVTARIHYTLMELALEDYWQLVESRRVLSS